MRLVLVSALLCGCVGSSVVICDDGRVCPPNAACDEAHGTCVLPDQLAACAGMVDGQECNIAGAAGVCRDEVCLPVGCGDLVVTGSEQCDGSAPSDKDDCIEHDFQNEGVVACKDDCTFDLSACSGRCGDGVINGPEKCDYAGQQLDGNDCTDFSFYTAAGLACSDACTFDTSGCSDRCGDGARNGPESCDAADLGGATCTDLGYYVSSGLACNAGCSFDTSSCTGFCGDRVTTTGNELCDGKLGPGLSCVGFGFDEGSLGCSAQCAPVVAGCRSPEQAPWPDVHGVASILFDDAWGSSPTNIFAVGCIAASSCTSYITHWNGTTWTPAAGVAGLGELRGVWGADGSNVFAVGGGGAIVRFNGGSWTQMTSNTTVQLNNIWGTAANNVIAIGENNTVLRYNGSTWAPFSPAFPGTPYTLAGIWGTGPQDFYVVGWSGGIWHFDGAWTQMTSNTSANLTGIWGASATEIYAVGWSGAIVRYDGSTWTPMTSGTSNSFFDISGSGSGDVYAVASGNTIRHFDGVTWKPMTTDSVGSQLLGVWVAGRREIYAVGNGGTIARFAGDGWARWHVPSTLAIQAIHVADDAILGLGFLGIIEIPGGQVTNSGLYALGGTSANVFAAGAGGTILQRTAPLTWTPVTSPTSQTISDISWPFAVGGGGTILRYSGGSWMPMTSPTTGFISDVWAYSDTVAFAVGGLGNVYRLSGGSWSAIAKPTTNQVWAVWGSSPTDVFVGADAGEIHHYNGSTWTKTSIGSQEAVYEIGGTSPADIFATTDTGVLHYDGLAWSPVRIPVNDTLSAINGGLLGGSTGTLIERRRHCEANESTCNDERDEDCDGYYDCGDSDCASNSACVTGGLCTGASTLACNSSIGGNTTSGGSKLARYACDAWTEHGRELVYKLTPTTGGTVTLALTGARDLDLIVLAKGAGGGCEPRNPGCLASSSKAGGNESVTFTATANTTYYVVVDGFGSSAGSFNLNAACP